MDVEVRDYPSIAVEKLESSKYGKTEREILNLFCSYLDAVTDVQVSIYIPEISDRIRKVSFEGLLKILNINERDSGKSLIKTLNGDISESYKDLDSETYNESIVALDFYHSHEFLLLTPRSQSDLKKIMIEEELGRYLVEYTSTLSKGEVEVSEDTVENLESLILLAYLHSYVFTLLLVEFKDFKFSKPNFDADPIAAKFFEDLNIVNALITKKITEDDSKITYRMKFWTDYFISSKTLLGRYIKGVRQEVISFEIKTLNTMIQVLRKKKDKKIIKALNELSQKEKNSTVTPNSESVEHLLFSHEVYATLVLKVLSSKILTCLIIKDEDLLIDTLYNNKNLNIEMLKVFMNDFKFVIETNELVSRVSSSKI